VIASDCCVVLAAWWQPRTLHSWDTTSRQSQGHFCALCHSESSWPLWRSQGPCILTGFHCC